MARELESSSMAATAGARAQPLRLDSADGTKGILRHLLLSCPRPETVVAALLDTRDGETAWIARATVADGPVRELLRRAGIEAASTARAVDLPRSAPLGERAESTTLGFGEDGRLVLLQSRAAPENELFLQGALSLFDPWLELSRTRDRLLRLEERMSQVRAGLRAGALADRAFEDLEGATQWLVDLRERFSAEAAALILEDSEQSASLLSDACTTTALQEDFLGACLHHYRSECTHAATPRLRWWNVADPSGDRDETAFPPARDTVAWPSLAQVSTTTVQGQGLWVFLGSRVPRAFAPESIEMLRSAVATSAHGFARVLEGERRSREQMQRLLRELPTGVLLVESDHGLGVANSEALELLGLSSVPEDLAELSRLTGASFDGVHASLTDAESADRPQAQVEVGRPPRTLHIEASRIEYPGTRPDDWLWTLRDVSVEQRRERARSEFVSTVGHELRTPLTSLRTALELIESKELGPLTAEQSRFVQLGRRASERLSSRVHQLLDVARNAAGRLDLRRESADLVDTLADSLAELEVRARREAREFRVELPEYAEAYVDRVRVAEILENLVINAFKFCPATSPVSVRIRREMPCPQAGDLELAMESGVEADGIELEVCDAGRGMSPATLQHAFDPFYQEGDPLSDRPEGVGLGLAIVRSLVLAHDGDLHVDSKPGQGTAVRIWIPRRAEMAALRQRCHAPRAPEGTQPPTGTVLAQ